MSQYTAAAQAARSIVNIDVARKGKRRPRALRRPRSVAAHLSPENRYALFDLGWLHANPALLPNELRVYLVLAAHADHRRGTCFPKVETIGRMAGIKDRRAATRALHGLQEKGAIVREFRKQFTTFYHIYPPPCVEAVRRIFPMASKTYPLHPG